MADGTNANAKGLSLETLIGALVHGNAADIATVETAHKGTGLRVGGEIFENIVADTVGKGIKGLPLLREILARTNGWGKYGLEAISIAVAPALAKRIADLAGKLGIDARTRGYIEVFFTDLGEGVSRGAIVASDPNRMVKIDKLVEQVTKRFDNALRDYLGVIHLARLAADGSVIEDSAKEPRPMSCVHWQQMKAGWDAQHPDTQVRGNSGNGKNNQNGQQNQQQPRDIFGAKIPYERGSYEIFVAGMAEPHLCPICFPMRSAEAKPAAPAKTWKEKVGAKGILLFDAVLDFPRTTPSGIDDIKGPDIATEATNVPVDEWADLANQIIPKTAGTPVTGFYAGCWQEASAKVAATATTKEIPAKEEGLTEKGFVLVLNKIVARGNGKLKPENVARVATLTVWEKAWKKESWADALKILGVALGALSAYVLSGVLIMAIYFVGLFYQFENEAWNTACITAGSIGALFWLLFWYTPEGIKRAFGGVLSFKIESDGQPSLANTARSITALLYGVGITALLIVDVGFLLDIKTAQIRTMAVPVIMLSLIALDRVVARWGLSKKIQEYYESLSLGNVRTLGWIATGMAVFAIVPLTAATYSAAQTTFQVAVVQQDGVFYVPTPNGGAFRPEDILGRIETDSIKREMGSAARLVVCQAKGSDIDLPGYSEMVEKKDGKDVACEDGGTGRQWVVRENFWGRRFDDGAKEYDSIAELVSGGKRSDSALVEAVRPAPAPAAVERKAPPAPAPAPVVQPTVVATESHEDYCKRIEAAGVSFERRLSKGCN